ncbi:hypothetical protein ABK040_009416 [Willaertia magna]
MSMRLRELIRAVRNCKTQSEERNVIAKECAAIRTALKEQHPYRARNAAKLMYIHMLGYPTNFGQIECVNLISSAKYPEKRIGYLSLMILLDENQEVLTLTQHRLKLDLNDDNQFVQALALTAVGNIASADICRDLSVEVEKLIVNSPSYIRKKASLCAVRIVSKCPELIENYIEKIDTILENEQHQRSHSAMLGVITLILTIVSPIKGVDAKERRNYVLHFRKQIPVFVRLLKALLNSNYGSEYEINGVADPFLQVKLIRLLRVLGKGSSSATEQMNEILAKVINSTEHIKNTGNAVLYECVRTIMEIDADQTLRVVAINQLGRFLSSTKDNNLKFVALHSLKKVSKLDGQAINRHLPTIIECLKDHDISIRKRALDLIYVIVNDSNVTVLAKELINHLEISPPEFREELTTKLCTVIEQHAPTKEWAINTLLEVITLSGQYVRDEIASIFIGLVTQTPELQVDITKKIYGTLKESIPKPHVLLKQEILMQIAAWCLGEYGDLIVDGQNIQETDVVNTLISLMNILPRGSVSNVKGRRILPTDPNNIIRSVVIVALLKLSNRFPSQVSTIQEYVSKYSDNVQVDLQQRSCELLNILNLTPEMRDSVLDRMPEIQIESIIGKLTRENSEKEEENTVTNTNTSTTTHQTSALENILFPVGNTTTSSGDNTLLDMLSFATEEQPIFNNETTNVKTETNETKENVNEPPKQNENVSNILNLFGDIITQPTTSTSVTNNNPLDSMFDDILVPNAQSQLGAVLHPQNKKVLEVYGNHGLSIRFEYKDMGDNVINTVAYFSNIATQDITNLDFRVAFPKGYELSLFKLSSTTVSAGSKDIVTQKFKVKAPQQTSTEQLPCRYKLSFNIGTEKVEEMGVN